MILVATRGQQELYIEQEGDKDAILVDNRAETATFIPLQRALKWGYWEEPTATTEKHLAGKHDQKAHAGGRGSGEATDLDTQIADAKKAVYKRMAEAKKSGDYSGMSQLRRRVKELETAKAAIASGGVQEEPKQVTNNLGQYDPAGLYSIMSGPQMTSSSGNHAKLAEAITDIAGRGAKVSDIAKLVAAPKGSSVHVEYNETDNQIDVSIDHPLLMDGMKVSLYRQRGRTRDEKGPVVMELVQLDVDEGAPNGTGTSILNEMVRQSRKRGIDQIQAVAARSSWENGYYTWPRLGFDGPIVGETAQKLPAKWRRADGRATRVSELMKSKEGRDWWRENGASIGVTFNPMASSANSMVLDSYINAKMNGE